MTGEILSKHVLRDRFAVAMSEMYCEEIPAYAALVEMVGEKNVNARSKPSKPLIFPDVEAGRAYHGAIRLGSVEDLRMLRRAFALIHSGPSQPDFVIDIAVNEFDGSFSAEHGLGRKNQKYYTRYTDQKIQGLSGQVKDILGPGLASSFSFSGAQPTY